MSNNDENFRHVAKSIYGYNDQEIDDFLKMIDNQIVAFYYFHIITVSNYLIIKSRKKIVFEFFPKI
jgi:hypothetical protein